MTRHILLILTLPFFLLASACSSDSDNATSPDAAPVFDASAPDADPASLCYPQGTYGSCSELGCPNCLSGANIYKVCTSSCTENSECGNAADFAGASPLCAPLNPGSTDMICVLTCSATEQCPCGLECRESGVPNIKICAETL